jgi:S-formylglutathione hydrolase FrmB
MKSLLFLALQLFIHIGALAGGSVSDGSFESPALGVQKSYRIYLPEGYVGGTRRYPVIYLLHGWGVTQKSWSSPALDLAGAADALQLNAMVVMPDGDRSLYANSLTAADYSTCLNDPNPQRNPREERSAFCVKTPRYADYIASDMVHHIDATYRTVARREARAITGESAGGFGAMSLAFRHPDVFSSVASHSGFLALLYSGPKPYVLGQATFHSRITPVATRAESEAIFGLDIHQWRKHDPYSLADKLKDGELSIYFDCGNDDASGFHDHALAFRDRLLALGIAHQFQSVPGGHDDALWRKQIAQSLQFHAAHFKAHGF